METINKNPEIETLSLEEISALKIIILHFFYRENRKQGLPFCFDKISKIIPSEINNSIVVDHSPGKLVSIENLDQLNRPVNDWLEENYPQLIEETKPQKKAPRPFRLPKETTSKKPLPFTQRILKALQR